MGAKNGAGGGMSSQNGWGKMFGSTLASQVGWLYPIAAIAAVLGLVWRRRRPRTDTVRAGYLLWSVWLAMYFLVFSAGSVAGHTYYMGVVAVPLAALTGAGVTQFWRAFRAGGRRAWALPAAVAATAGWGAVIAWDYPTFLSWLGPVVLGLGVVALVLLALGRPGGRATGRRVALAGLVAGLAAMLIAPAAWASSVFESQYGHNAMGTVGPASSFGGGGGGGRGATALAGDARRTGGTGRFGAGGAGAGGASGGMGAMFGGGGSTLTAQQKALLSYTEAHRDGAKYVFATTSWSTASPYIMADGADVLPMGGFTGEVPSPTLAQVQQDVASGQLHYVLLSGGTGGAAGGFAGFGGFGGGGGASAPSTKVADWVRSSCTVVPASAYGAATGTTPGAASGAQQLYQCGATG